MSKVFSPTQSHASTQGRRRQPLVVVGGGGGGGGGGGVSNFRRLCTKQQMENTMNSPQLTPDEKVHSNELN
jgi:hypothetical protein